MARDLTYRFRLSDEEFARAWIAEYYRRPGLRVWRVIGGPIFIGIGLVMSLGGGDIAFRGMGGLTLLMGIWYLVKPFLAMRAMRAHRRKSGRSDVELRLTLGRKGIDIDDGQGKQHLEWKAVTRAGKRRDYVWYELRGGNRATIPTRAIDDLDALRALFEEHARWE